MFIPIYILVPVLVAFWLATCVAPSIDEYQALDLDRPRKPSLLRERFFIILVVVPLVGLVVFLVLA